MPTYGGSRPTLLRLMEDLQSYLQVPVHPFQQGTMQVVGGGVNAGNNILETEIEEGLRLERFGLV